MTRWRLIIDPRYSGPENMAVDEAVLRVADSSASALPTLRVYGWSAPTISIGYLQNASPFGKTGLPVVRRITGGRAVLHFNELTYSIVAGVDDEPFSGGITAAYSAISACVIEALRLSGVAADFARAQSASGKKDACFHSPSRFEVLVSGRKLVGSAQRRFKRCFLQHGSVLLGIDREMNSRVFGPEVIDRMASVSEFSPVEESVFRDFFIRSIERGLGADFTVSGLDDAEAELKEALKKSKYLDPGWNGSGVDPGRVTAAGTRFG